MTPTDPTGQADPDDLLYDDLIEKVGDALGADFAAELDDVVVRRMNAAIARRA